MQRKHVILILLLYFAVQFIPVFQVALDFTVYGLIYVISIENRWLVLIYEFFLTLLSLFCFNKTKTWFAHVFFLLLSVFFIKSFLSVLGDMFLNFSYDPVIYAAKEYWIEPLLIIVVVMSSFSKLLRK